MSAPDPHPDSRPQAESHPLHDSAVHHFASDNYAGVHPDVLSAIARANGGHQVAYGEDEYTAALQNVARRHFGDGATVWPVFNGTGANVLSLQALLPRWGAVVCAETAHINTDENAAPERVAGLKLLTVPTPDGKLTPELIDRQAWGFGDEHRAQPAAVSITQTTELGTCYTADEVRAICEHAHTLGLKVHLDGSRIAQAGAFLGGSLSEFTVDAGVDVISLGGTKNGALGAEAVVIVDPALGDLGMPYLRKMNMQLASKMRFVSAQLTALYDGDLWLRNAATAHALAVRLADGVRDLPGVTVTQPVESNGVFAVIPAPAAAALRERFRFYDWNVATGEVRWMCAWDVTEELVDNFVAAVRAAVGATSS